MLRSFLRGLCGRGRRAQFAVLFYKTHNASAAFQVYENLAGETANAFLLFRVQFLRFRVPDAERAESKALRINEWHCAVELGSRRVHHRWQVGVTSMLAHVPDHQQIALKNGWRTER